MDYCSYASYLAMVVGTDEDAGPLAVEFLHNNSSYRRHIVADAVWETQLGRLLPVLAAVVDNMVHWGLADMVRLDLAADIAVVRLDPAAYDDIATEESLQDPHVAVAYSHPVN